MHFADQMHLKSYYCFVIRLLDAERSGSDRRMLFAFVVSYFLFLIIKMIEEVKSAFRAFMLQDVNAQNIVFCLICNF